MGLIGYAQHTGGAICPPPLQGGLFDYVLAADGVYVHARREELEVCFLIARCELRGVEPLLPQFKCALPKVPAEFVGAMVWDMSYWAKRGLETLWHVGHSELWPQDDGWFGTEPEQHRTPGSCRPVEDHPASHERAIIEIHSHHSMAARFSSTDNKDEQGFRLYAVIGRLPAAPEIRLRVGVYGAGFWEIPATWAMELPDGLRDCNAMEGE